MTTYGWALIIIIATIGVLMHFGFLNPSKYIPESCNFGEQLQCEDHMLTDNGTMKFRFKNNFRADINITNVNITNKDNADTNLSAQSSYTIEKGNVKKVELEINKNILNDNQKTDLKMTFSFHRTGSDINHNISGNTYTQVSESDLI